MVIFCVQLDLFCLRKITRGIAYVLGSQLLKGCFTFGYMYIAQYEYHSTLYSAEMLTGTCITKQFMLTEVEHGAVVYDVLNRFYVKMY